MIAVTLRLWRKSRRRHSRGIDHGTLKVTHVPQDNGGDEQVESRSAVLLVLIGSVADFLEPTDEHRRRQTAASLALVQLLSCLPAELRLADPVEREQGTFKPSQLAQRGGDPVLPRIGSELAQDHRGRRRPGADRGDDPRDLRPVRPDEGNVDPAGDHRLQRGIGGRLAEAVEPPMLEVWDAARTGSRAGCKARRRGRNHRRHRCGAC